MKCCWDIVSVFNIKSGRLVWYGSLFNMKSRSRTRLSLPINDLINMWLRTKIKFVGTKKCFLFLLFYILYFFLLILECVYFDEIYTLTWHTSVYICVSIFLELYKNTFCIPIYFKISDIQYGNFSICRKI